jgi:hypothetical protein
MWFTHLSARTSVKAETKNPRPLAIVHFLIPSAALRRILACNSRFAMQIQVGRHSDGHAEQKPCFILLIPLDSPTAV